MAWHLARSLETLRSQVNAASPLRNKQNDGTIGDDDHRRRDSHHNPNDLDAVTAMDITHDPGGGCDAGQLAETLRLNRDPRINNVIFNGRIFSSTVSPWIWRPRNRGPDDHTEHVHIAVGRGDDGHATNPELYDDPAPWAIRALPGTIPAPSAPGAARFTDIKATVFNDGIRPGTKTAYRFPMPADFMGYSLPGRIAGELPLRITNRVTGLSAIGNKADIGPWYAEGVRGGEDRWWENGTRPRAETDSQTNGAGIDLYPALARAIGVEIVERGGRIVAGEAQVDVEIISEAPPMAESSTTDALLRQLIEQVAALARVIHFGREPVEPPVVTKPADPPKADPVVTAPPAAPPVLKTPGMQISSIAGVLIGIAQLAGWLPPSLGENATQAGIALSAAPIGSALIDLTGGFGGIGTLIKRVFGRST